MAGEPRHTSLWQNGSEEKSFESVSLVSLVDECNHFEDLEEGCSV